MLEIKTLKLRYARKKAMAKYWGQEFTLTFNDYLNLAVSTPTCPILNIALDYSTGEKKGYLLNAATLDRIDNSRGYTPDNVWIISRKANNCKSDLSLEQLKTLVKLLEEKLTNVS